MHASVATDTVQREIETVLFLEKIFVVNFAPAASPHPGADPEISGEG